LSARISAGKRASTRFSTYTAISLEKKPAGLGIRSTFGIWVIWTHKDVAARGLVETRIPRDLVPILKSAGQEGFTARKTLVLASNFLRSGTTNARRMPGIKREVIFWIDFTKHVTHSSYKKHIQRG
jgi:hypothetical protein